LHPVLAHLPSLSVCYQLIRIECYIKIQIVIDHNLESLAFYTLTSIAVNGVSTDLSVRSEPVCIDTACCEELIQKFGGKFFMPLLWNISKGILQCKYSIFSAESSLSLRCAPDSLCKRRYRWKFFYYFIKAYSHGL